MSARRPPLMRKAPTSESRTAGVGQVVTQTALSAKESTNHAPSRIDDDVAKSRQELLEQFRATMRSESPIADEDANNDLSRHFEDALMAMSDDELLKPVSIDDIKSTLRTLHQAETDGMEAVERGNLARKLDEALKPLERRETQLAFEFNRKLQVDGKESALAWLQEQLAAPTQNAPTRVADPASQTERTSSSTDITQSRSRRLRGPPRRR